MENDKLVELSNFIAQKEKELFELRQNYHNEASKSFEHLIGKYFQISVNCAFKVIEICGVEGSEVYCEGIGVEGTPKHSIDFNIDFKYGHEFDVRYMPKEITKEEFWAHYLTGKEHFENKLRNEISIESTNSWFEQQYKYHHICARATLYPGKSLEEVEAIVEDNLSKLRNKD